MNGAAPESGAIRATVERFNLVGPRDTPLDGRYVVARTRTRRAICYVPEATTDTLNAALREAKEFGCERPIQVYGFTCRVGETPSFRFHQMTAPPAGGES